MERPSLSLMIEEIKKGNIQTVVVYKVDRLSRSIMDFHNMMKEFEKYNCNFVSITQAFDTSTSMGKLTLNMLLSFAQFEREVSSERVRDKLYASKAKGMWMGSIPPFGYDVVDKKLVPNKKEAETINYMFEEYLKSPSLRILSQTLKEKGIKSKTWKSEKGNIIGGKHLSKNVIARMLRDPIYIGKITNKKTNDVFNGKHKAILDKELFDAVKTKLDNKNTRGSGKVKANSYLLHNKIITADGVTFKNMKTSRTKNRITYRYYTIPNFYLPAGDIDNITRDIIQDFLDSDMYMLPQETKLAFKQILYNDKLVKDMVSKIIYHDNKLTYFINISDTKYLQAFTSDGYLNTKTETLENSYLSEDMKYLVIDKDIMLQKGTALSNKYTGKGTNIITKKENANALIKALSIAWRYKKLYEGGMRAEEIQKQEKISSRTVYKYLNLVYISPRIVNDIMDSQIPQHINLQKLFEIASKYRDFNKQEKVFYR